MGHSLKLQSILKGPRHIQYITVVQIHCIIMKKIHKNAKLINIYQTLALSHSPFNMHIDPQSHSGTHIGHKDLWTLKHAYLKLHCAYITGYTGKRWNIIGYNTYCIGSRKLSKNPPSPPVKVNAMLHEKRKKHPWEWGTLAG